MSDKLKEIKCSECQQLFMQKTQWSKFCSIECYNKDVERRNDFKLLKPDLKEILQRLSTQIISVEMKIYQDYCPDRDIYYLIISTRDEDGHYLEIWSYEYFIEDEDGNIIDKKINIQVGRYNFNIAFKLTNDEMVDIMNNGMFRNAYDTFSRCIVNKHNKTVKK